MNLTFGEIYWLITLALFLSYFTGGAIRAMRHGRIGWVIGELWTTLLISFFLAMLWVPRTLYHVIGWVIMRLTREYFPTVRPMNIVILDWHRMREC